MPFKSDKQRRFLWSQKPEVARKFAEHKADGGPLKIGGRRVTPGQKVGQSNLKGVLSGAVDFVPVVGDAKAFAEAETPWEYGLAGLGLVPGVGDVAASALKGFGPLVGRLKPSGTARGAVDPNRHKLHRADVSPEEKLERAADAEWLYNKHKKGENLGSAGDLVYESVPDQTGKLRDVVRYENKPGSKDKYHWFMFDKDGKAITQFEGSGPLAELSNKPWSSTARSYVIGPGETLGTHLRKAKQTPLGKQGEAAKLLQTGPLTASADTLAAAKAAKEAGMSSKEVAAKFGISASAAKKL